MKTYCVLLLAMSLCTACLQNPYVRSTSTEGIGRVVPTFAYGKFCGPHHPVLRQQEEGKEQVTYTELRSLWPPADDLDTVCYAHDYCVQQAYQESFVRQAFMPMRTLCDQAFTRTLADFNEDFEDDGCFNLAHDMATGMYMRGSEQSSEQAAAAIVFAVFSSVSRSARAKTDEYPDEGACNLVTQSSPDMILDAYEYYFDKSRARGTDTDLVIPRISTARIRVPAAQEESGSRPEPAKAQPPVPR